MVGSTTTANGIPSFFTRANCVVKSNDDKGATVPQESYTPMALDQKEFRGVLSQFGSGVAVITTEDETGDKAGMTVSSFTSLSLDPPLILFCAKEGSKTMAEIQENGHFAVSVLREDQKDLCYQFAGKSDTDKFKNVSSQAGKAHGDPLLDGAIATLECKLSTLHPGGDHSIVVGEVIAMSKTPENDQPLLFWDGKVLPPRG